MNRGHTSCLLCCPAAGFAYIKDASPSRVNIDTLVELNGGQLTVDMKQWSRFSSEKRTPSLMKTALALRMKEKNRLIWM